MKDATQSDQRPTDVLEPAGLAAYGLGLLVARATGFHPSVPYHYYQLLARGPLTERLGESLWNLHSQPPLLNLELGLALKAERAWGLDAAALLFAFQAMLGAVAVWALARLLRRLEVRPWLRALVLALVVASPALYAFVHFFFYPSHELCLLALAALAGQRLLEAPTPGRVATLAAPLVALVYTRSLFHPLWAAAALVTLAAAAGAFAAGARRRANLAVVALAVATLAAWPLKNELRFGVPGFTSWTGFNLAAGIPIQYPDLWLAFALKSPPGANEARLRAEALVPERFRDIPVLARAEKENGFPNWNHVAMIEVSAELGRRALAAIGERPGLLLDKVAANFASFCRYPGLHPYRESRDVFTQYTAEPAGRAWFLAHQAMTLETRFAVASREVSPLVLTFPLLVGFALWRALARRRTDPAGSTTVLFLLAAVLWVFVLVLVIDGAEANRIRFSTEPLLWVAGAWAVGRSAPSDPRKTASRVIA